MKYHNHKFIRYKCTNIEVSSCMNLSFHHNFVFLFNSEVKHYGVNKCFKQFVYQEQFKLLHNRRKCRQESAMLYLLDEPLKLISSQLPKSQVYR